MVRAGWEAQRSGSVVLHCQLPLPRASRGACCFAAVAHPASPFLVDAVRSKLLLLLAPFLKRWNYARHAEQITGGHKYLPPRQDVNAPGEGGPTMGCGDVQQSCPLRLVLLS